MSDGAELRSLAREVRGLLDACGREANTSEEGRLWSGPNATDVRGTLGTWRTRLDAMATDLETEATARGADGAIGPR